MVRIKQTGARSMIANACKQFQKRFPHIKKFSDLDLAEAKKIKLSEIYIDITIQRLLNLPWVAEIISKFREAQADPIKLYEVTAGGDLEDDFPLGTKLFAS
jgi:hypothetical protein